MIHEKNIKNNNMSKLNIKPLADRVLVEPLEAETKTASGKCFLDIAEHLSMRPNFSNYMYRQDMVMDAVENCVVYCANFDPEKSKNPFSYFTQVCWYAFIRRIGKEKRQIEICDKIIAKSGFEEFFVGDQLGASSDFNSIKDAVEQKRNGSK